MPRTLNEDSRQLFKHLKVAVRYLKAEGELQPFVVMVTKEGRGKVFMIEFRNDYEKVRILQKLFEIAVMEQPVRILSFLEAGMVSGRKEDGAMWPQSVKPLEHPQCVDCIVGTVASEERQILFTLPFRKFDDGSIRFGKPTKVDSSVTGCSIGGRILESLDIWKNLRKEKEGQKNEVPPHKSNSKPL